MNNEISPLKKLSDLIKNSVMVKISMIALLILLLLIPTSMVKSLITEREMLSQSAINEVSSKWSGRQSIDGPVLSIPFTCEVEESGKKIQQTKYWHILPELLEFEGEIAPKSLKRGIYEIMVYQSVMGAKGYFQMEELVSDEKIVEVKYDRAFVTIGISDLKGIEDEVFLVWNGGKIKAKPGTKIPEIISTGVTIDLPNLKEELDAKIDFGFDLRLQGSQNLSFVPLGSTTKVKISSPWQFPSFAGNFLPDNRDVSKEGFQADWKVLQLNRNFPQSWVGNRYRKDILDTAFGVDLLLPVDDYHKSMRSAKYAAMTISLVFLIFFLVEILNKKRIHPFQYALVGLAVCLFYVLLVSITEHSNFNFSYLVSSVAIIAMISLYSIKLLKSGRLSILLLFFLTGVFGFVFVTLQLNDYALLMGSVGLTMILALAMYFTRNIDWYKLHIETN